MSHSPVHEEIKILLEKRGRLPARIILPFRKWLDFVSDLPLGYSVTIWTVPVVPGDVSQIAFDGYLNP